MCHLASLIDMLYLAPRWHGEGILRHPFDRDLLALWRRDDSLALARVAVVHVGGGLLVNLGGMAHLDALGLRAEGLRKRLTVLERVVVETMGSRLGVE